MTFTDDDLERLKKYINVRRDLSRDVPVHPDVASFFSEVEVLLARLKAAEKFAEYLQAGMGCSHDHICNCPPDDMNAICLRNKWRKAKGK